MEQSPKQQLSELLRNSDSIAVTTNKNPSVDDVAAVAALTLMLNKMGKKVDAVISKIPNNLQFLPVENIKSEPGGSRDFIIELDTSKTEADKLKYTTEGHKIRIYITPYEGNYSNKDVEFNYGDYHTQAVVALGVANRNDLDSAFEKHGQLLKKAQLVTITNGAKPPVEGAVSWHEEATSLCEMLMSLSESLESGILDEKIATALLTGIIEKTEHFTSQGTTPKVMTMSAQLMAAGAKQAEIIHNLDKSSPPPIKSEQQKPEPTKSSSQSPKKMSSNRLKKNQVSWNPQKNSQNSVKNRPKKNQKQKNKMTRFLRKVWMTGNHLAKKLRIQNQNQPPKTNFPKKRRMIKIFILRLQYYRQNNPSQPARILAAR